jgi:hypothetical protein
VKRNSQEVRSRLDKTLTLLVLVALRGMRLKEQVSLMSAAGFDRNEMARILGTTPNSVSVRLNELKREVCRQRPGESR